MNLPTHTSLDEQRQTLRNQLSLQRHELTKQLSPSTEIQGHFPRSLTMRLITQEPALAAQLLMGVTVFIIGPRFSKALAAAFTFSKIALAATPEIRKRLYK